jgi:hypothetical protein
MIMRCVISSCNDDIARTGDERDWRERTICARH